MHWLRKGDQNAKYFFKCVIGKRNRKSNNGIILEDDAFSFEKSIIKGEFIKHSKNVLSSDKECHLKEDKLRNLIGFRLLWRWLLP